MCSESVSVTLVELPDDLLLTALQYLRVEDLLACRLVCKRLCGLVLHRDVWRDRTLTGISMRYVPPAHAVLRLAPCLKKATVDEQSLPSFLTTRCAVQHLTMHAGDEMGWWADKAPEYIQVVRRQEALGRLRHVVLLWDCGWGDIPDDLLRTLLTMSIESFRLGSLYHRDISPPQGLPGPFLKRFRCGLAKGAQCFVNAVLALHAATLESVDVSLTGSYANLSGNDNAGQSTSRLLASLPKLRVLRCRWIYGLEEVAACETLRDLSLEDNFAGLHATDGAEKLLCRATQLRSVLIAQCNSTAVKKLIDALAVPGRALERLVVYVMVRDIVEPLCRALPALRQLSVVQLDSCKTDEELDELLQAITCDSAPALRLLVLGFVNRRCAHAWMHREVLQSTLQANPSLHIVRDIGDTCYSESCEDCSRGCHEEVGKRSNFHLLGIFSHINKCPAPEHHRSYISGFRMTFITTQSVVWVRN